MRHTMVDDYADYVPLSPSDLARAIDIAYAMSDVEYDIAAERARESRDWTDDDDANDYDDEY